MVNCSCDTFTVPVTCTNNNSTPALTANNSGGLCIKADASGYSDAAYIRANGSGCAVWGENYGSGTGVAGSTEAYQKAGINGTHVSTTNVGYGVYGAVSRGGSKCIYAYSDVAEGVYGVHSNITSSSMSTSSCYSGVFHATAGGTGSIYSVYGQSVRTSGTGNTIGVYGKASGSTTAVGGKFEGTYMGSRSDCSTSGGMAIYGIGSGGAKGLVVSGNSEVSGSFTVYGNLTKTSGSFVIDHPLDPENKILTHSFVESPDMKNIYDGVVVADSNGEAVVDLPGYFDALNCDIRYQLTSVGGAAPLLHVAQEVKNNQFKLAGALPRMKVSWQITGSRQDAYAKANPIVVEKDKDEDKKGLFISPEVFGKDKSKHIAFKVIESDFDAVPSK